MHLFEQVIFIDALHRWDRYNFFYVSSIGFSFKALCYVQTPEDPLFSFDRECRIWTLKLL